MEEKKVSTLFEEMKDDFSNYISNRLKLLKLQTYIKTSKTVGLLTYGLIIVLLMLLALSMVFITLAIYLGSLLESMPLGFAIVSLFAILIVIVVILSRKSIRSKFTNIMVSSLMSDDDEDDNKK
ncbi:MAG TPA: phage holin family protein [Dysgonamonadaceae bacterium]|nr:phage holin family protein [Dysgonamonadaceae bacterium]